MTKGDIMQCEDIIDEETALRMARRLAIQDFALKYRTSLHMAEKLLTGSTTALASTSPQSREDLEVRAAWTRTVCRERQNDTINTVTDEMEQMDVDSDSERESREPPRGSSPTKTSFPSREDQLFHQREGSPNEEHFQSAGLMRRDLLLRKPINTRAGRVLAETHNNRFVRQRNPSVQLRPIVWPYYARYPAYMVPFHMFPRGYPYSAASRGAEPLTSRVRASPDLPPDALYYPPSTTSTTSPSREHPRQTTEAEVRTQAMPYHQERKKRPFDSSLRRTLLRARSLDNSELRNPGTSHEGSEGRSAVPTKAKTLLRTKSLDNELASPNSERTEDERHLDDDILVTNSQRPSVLVMQRSSSCSPISVTNDDNEMTSWSPEFEGSDDHETTDSDSTPPMSPRSRHSVNSSDERFSSDSPRSGSDSSKEKPHKCHICSRAFKKHSALIIHHRVHSGEKPYKCPECSKQFSISGNLRRHFLIHTGERPYICPECSRAFNNPSHLTRHRRKLHQSKPKSDQE